MAATTGFAFACKVSLQAGTESYGLDLKSNPIINVGYPLVLTDAANAHYVHDVVSTALSSSSSSSSSVGKLPVDIGTVTALPAYTWSTGGVLTATSNAVLVVNTITLLIDQRVLVKDEIGSNMLYNGIYVVTDPGSSATPYILSRTNDFALASDVVRGQVVVVAGRSGIGPVQWFVDCPTGSTPDTDPIIFRREEVVVVGASGMTSITYDQTSNGTTMSSAFNCIELDGTAPWSMNIPAASGVMRQIKIVSLTNNTVTLQVGSSMLLTGGSLPNSITLVFGQCIDILYLPTKTAWLVVSGTGFS